MKRVFGKGVAWDLAAAILVYACTRLLVLHTAFDQTAMPMFELFPMGTLAELGRQGVDLPLDYIYDNAGGQLLIGYLTRPFFALFGSNYFALKLVPFTLGLGVLVLLWAFLRANFSARAATIGAFLFALAPTTLFKYSLMNSGNHFENLFFVMLAAVCSYRFLRAGGRGWLALSGFTSGLALFVFLGALIPVGLFAGLHAGVRGFKQSVRDLGLWALGFAIGLSPLVIVNLATGARGLGFLHAKFAETDERAQGSVFERAWEFVVTHVPASTLYEPLFGLSRTALGLAFFAAFFVAYASSAPGALRATIGLVRGLARGADGESERFERARLVPFVLYLPLAALAFGISNFRIGGYGPPIEAGGYRYFLPTLLFALVLVAVIAARWIERGGPRRVAGVVLCAVPLVCGLANLTIVDWSFAHTGRGAHYLGYNLAAVGRALIAGRNALTQDEISAHVRSFPPLMRHRVATAIGFNRGTLYIEDEQARALLAGADPAWRIDLPRLTAGLPPEVEIDLARGQGIALRFTSGGGPAGVATIVRVLEAQLVDAPRLGPCVAEGACLLPGTEPLVSRTPQLLGLNATLRDATQGALHEHVMRGTGLLVGRLLVRDIADERALLDEWIAASAGSREFFVGLGQGLADGADEPLAPETLARTNALALEDQVELWRGFGFAVARAREEHDVDAALGRYAPADLAPELRAAFLAGCAWTSYPVR
jgi:hypothetical protein